MAKKSCKRGYYYCYASKKCKKIPMGYYVGSGGWLRKEEEKEDTEGKKNGNGNGSNGNGSGSGDSNGGSDGGGVSEGWSAKYKRSIDCDNPKGFSQRAHCKGRKKMTEEKKEGCDHEVVMARKQVKKSMDNLKKLAKVLAKKSECEDLPAWVQAKITDTEHNTDAAASYMSEGRRDGKSAKDKDYSLRDWFKGGGWVQVSGKYKGKPCAKQPGQKTKPFCRDADDAAAMSTKEKKRRTAKKRKEDPNSNRKGKAKIVTASYSNWRAELQQLDELAPVAVAAGLTALAAAPYLAKRFLTKKVNKAIERGRNELHLNNKPFGAGARGLDKQSFELEGQLVERVDYKEGDIIDHSPKEKEIIRKANTPEVLLKLEKGQKKLDKIQPSKPKNPLTIPNWTGTEEVSIQEGKKDACYKKVKSRYKIWPSAYASGALVKCRKVGAANWGNKTRKEGYEFSNWRDEFYPNDVETVNIIEPQPLQPSKGIGSEILGEKKDPCWDGYKQVGMKKKGKKMVPNCVKEGQSNWREELSEKYAGQYDKGMPGSKPYGGRETGPVQDPDYLRRRINDIRDSIPVKKASTKKTTQVAHFEPEGELIEDWQKSNRKDGVDGMSQKSVNAYKRENPGSKLQTAVTEKKPTGKRAKRRKSFCARSKGQKDMHNIDCSKTPEKKICKARKRWRC